MILPAHNRSLYGLGALLILGALGVIFFGFFNGGPLSPPLSEERLSPLRTVEGLRYGKWSHGRPVMTMTAKRLEVKKRAFLALRVRSIHQVLLHDVRITLFQPTSAENNPLPPGTPIRPAPPSLAEGFQGIQAAVAGGGNRQRSSKTRITRGLLAPFTLTVRQGRDTLLRFKARHGVIKPGDRKTTFTDGLLEQPRTQKKIAARTIHWDDERKEFHIPGDYLAESPKGRGRGRGLTVGLDFSLRPMPR